MPNDDVVDGRTVVPDGVGDETPMVTPKGPKAQAGSVKAKSPLPAAAPVPVPTPVADPYDGRGGAYVSSEWGRRVPKE